MTAANQFHSIQFIDLAKQQASIRHNIDAAISRVLDQGVYILGSEVAELERQLAVFCGAKYCVTCANGTDAISLLLLAKGIGVGDAVFVPSFTFAATAEVVADCGATPFFVDSYYDTYNLNPASLKQGIVQATSMGLSPKAVMPVDLFGLPADYDEIGAIAAENNLYVFCDAAQGFGATYKNRKVGSIGHATTTSFFPAKPLGCYGDGGAIFTHDEDLASVLESLRVHGKGKDKYDNIRIGRNSRLDTLQAAILIQKLAIFAEEISSRNRIAHKYSAALSSHFTVPVVPVGLESVWAQYTLKINKDKRDDLMSFLKDRGIPSAIYYPLPLHKQTAYKEFPRVCGACAIAETLAQEVVSLPMHPYLSNEELTFIIETMLNWYGNQ